MTKYIIYTDAFKENESVIISAKSLKDAEKKVIELIDIQPYKHWKRDVENQIGED